MPGIDAEKGTLFGKPAAMGGFWGSHLGIIDLMLERDGNSWKVTGFETSAPSIYKRDGRKRVPLVESQQSVLDSVAKDTTRRSPMCVVRSARLRLPCTPISR